MRGRCPRPLRARSAGQRRSRAERGSRGCRRVRGGAAGVAPALTHVPHDGAGQLQRVDAAHDGHGLGGQQGAVGAALAAGGRCGSGRQLLGGQQEAEGGGRRRPAALREAAQLAAVAALQVPPALLQVLHVAGAGGHRVHLVPDQLPHLPLLARGGAAGSRREQQLLVLQHLLDQHLRLRLVEIRLAPFRRVLGHSPPRVSAGGRARSRGEEGGTPLPFPAPRSAGAAASRPGPEPCWGRKYRA